MVSVPQGIRTQDLLTTSLFNVSLPFLHGLRSYFAVTALQTLSDVIVELEKMKLN